MVTAMVTVAVQVAEVLSGSLELGCFLAGVVISSRGAAETEQVRYKGFFQNRLAVILYANCKSKVV